jgi:hypothetical protein
MKGKGEEGTGGGGLGLELLVSYFLDQNSFTLT